MDRNTILAKLTGNTALMALLTGGVHSATEINRQLTPNAFDTNGELKPCALMKLESESPAGPYLTSERLFFVLFFYQRSGYDVIDQVRELAFALLNHCKLAGGVWEVQFVGDVHDLEDQALGCAMAVSRFVAVRLR